jgi:GIY-YIG catalytic domain
MPKVSIDYSKTIMYKIVCNDLNIENIYVGSTTNFIKRKQSHKNNCNNENSKKYNFKIYQTIRSNGGWINWTMVEIEKYPCNDSNEARSRERFWYEQLDANLNINTPIISKQEKQEKIKKYREIKKDYLCEQNKQYYKNNKEKILEYYQNYKDNRSEQTKKYYQKHKDTILEQRKQYYENNKDSILKQKKEYYKMQKIYNAPL